MVGVGLTVARTQSLLTAVPGQRSQQVSLLVIPFRQGAWLAEFCLIRVSSQGRSNSFLLLPLGREADLDPLILPIPEVWPENRGSCRAKPGPPSCPTVEHGLWSHITWEPEQRPWAVLEHSPLYHQPVEPSTAYPAEEPSL